MEKKCSHDIYFCILLLITNQMKSVLSAILLLSLCTTLRAQDPHFSQFFSSPLTLNPALTGRFDGNFRIAGNYRNQWPTINNAFTTATASFDMPIMANRLPEYDTWGVGIMGLNDRSGNKILNNNFVSVSTAYHKGLDENGYHQLTVGFQGTFASKRLDVTRADFEDELTALGFTGVTSEVFNNSQVAVNYFDLNTGIMYAGTTNSYNSFYLGASVYHINRPKESFQGGNFLLNPRVTIHGGGYTPIGQFKMLHASFIHQRQAGAVETVAGAAMSFNVNYDEENPIDLYGGMWYRFNDALIPYVGLEFSGIRLGFSYDFNTSSLKTASNGRGGTEISLIYVSKPADKTARKTNCPKF
jgi:type IX secretion system PorP/SprF family membrane protein